MVGRIAGLLVLALVLLVAARAGAPPLLVVLIAGVNLATLLLPGGVGAKAAGNLARRLYDRPGWEANWSSGYLPGDARRAVREPVPRGEDPWVSTLREIRALPEVRSRGRRRRT